MTNKEAVRLKIKQQREAHGLVAVQLAEEVGVTQRYIYKIEAGESMPAWKVAARLLDVLGMSLEEIVNYNIGEKGVFANMKSHIIHTQSRHSELVVRKIENIY